MTATQHIRVSLSERGESPRLLEKRGLSEAGHRGQTYLSILIKEGKALLVGIVGYEMNLTLASIIFAPATIMGNSTEVVGFARDPEFPIILITAIP